MKKHSFLPGTLLTVPVRPTYCLYRFQENAGGDRGDDGGSASEEEAVAVRVPTAVATLFDHGLVVVGFDSGEVQTYSGFPSALNVAAGFRIADAQPVLFVRLLDKWNPFHNVHISADLGERCAVRDTCMYNRDTCA